MTKVIRNVERMEIITTAPKKAIDLRKTSDTMPKERPHPKFRETEMNRVMNYIRKLQAKQESLYLQAKEIDDQLDIIEKLLTRRNER